MRILTMCIALISLAMFNWITVLILAIILLGKQILETKVYHRNGESARIIDLIMLRFGRYGRFEAIFDNGVEIYRTILIRMVLELSFFIVFILKVGQLIREFLPYFMIPLILGTVMLWLPAMVSNLNHYNESKKGCSTIGFKAIVLKKHDDHMISIRNRNGGIDKISIREIDWNKIQVDANVEFIRSDEKDRIYSPYFETI